MTRLLLMYIFDKLQSILVYNIIDRRHLDEYCYLHKKENMYKYILYNRTRNHQTRTVGN